MKRACHESEELAGVRLRRCPPRDEQRPASAYTAKSVEWPDSTYKETHIALFTISALCHLVVPAAVGSCILSGWRPAFHRRRPDHLQLNWDRRACRSAPIRAGGLRCRASLGFLSKPPARRKRVLGFLVAP